MATVISIGDVKFELDKYSLVYLTADNIYHTIHEFEDLETIMNNIINKNI